MFIVADLVSLIERVHLIWLLMVNMIFSLVNNHKGIIYGHVRKFVELSIFYNIFYEIWLLSKKTNCVLLIADMFLFLWERLHNVYF